ncbi:tRNA pseudouridine synthase [Chlorella sorokiniana]|uniref:tRNA pseudouridine synthase n=1 Tax=Chlorella sorokiniana TaxID=3076 RepID=A0A2P6TFJ8_CHLSO|nr:tRNA pseudouridine synthase [Chlorella sorokiniana]|eukprot:PRW32888.1 tRNA pseudouridine synthase [Chlorella sorokiniana]
MGGCNLRRVSLWRYLAGSLERPPSLNFEAPYGGPLPTLGLSFSSLALQLTPLLSALQPASAAALGFQRLELQGRLPTPAAVAACTQLRQLRELSMDNADFYSGHEEAVAALLQQATGLSALTYSCRNNVPACLTGYRGLTSLTLSGGRLDVPAGDYLTDLRHLDLHHNLLFRLPSTISMATGLTQLRLDDNVTLMLLPSDAPVLLALPQLQWLSCKRLRNSLFREGKFPEAAAKYAEALEQDPEDAALYSNRSAARLKAGQAADALADAQAAIMLRPDWDKAHFRLGCALEQLGQLDQALEAFEAGLDINSSSRELSDRVRQLKKRMRQEQQAAGGLGGPGAPAAAAGRGGSAGGLAGVMSGGATGWAAGLSEAKRYEWLVDCYRMRVDDEYAWQGEARGLYGAQAGGCKEDVVEDFLIFCKLAVANGVVPQQHWDWGKFLRIAADLLPYAFEKSDASDKWGGENIFAAAMGGRSLRATAEVVFGSGLSSHCGPSEAEQDLIYRIQDQLHELLAGQGEGPAMFADVGGQAVWRKLLKRAALFSISTTSVSWKAYKSLHGSSCKLQARPLAAAAVAVGKDVPPAATTATTPAEDEAAPKRAGKRKVALYVGYEGTEYRGLQMQTATAPLETIEDALEEAIFKAGGILASNRGQPSKVSWSRSSRTDKSVHSLATVVAMKMEVEPESFDTDPEGQALAAAINASLPPEVRVFSIQRVSKSWNARSECIRRCYNYYLPASILGLKLDGSEADAARLELLRTAWERFQGTHPFHNYTKRRLYREPAAASDGRRKGRRDRRGEDQESESGSEADESEVEGNAAAAAAAVHVDSSSQSSQAEGSAAADGSSVSAEASSSGSSGQATDGAPGGQQQGEGGEVLRRHQVQLQWKYERDNSDPVTRRHFRYIEWCRADIEPKALVPGGEPCVRLSLQGGSFMLHQIRHMVGTAVAVARGHLPLELLDASMATPARMNLPLAPPSTLMLMAALFSPFKRSYTGEVAAAAQWTGDTLQLREAGQAAQQAFLQEVMLPALNGLLAGEEWQYWATDLDRLWVDEAQLEELLSAYRAQQERKAAAIAECELKQR